MIPLVLGVVGDTVVTLFCEAFVGDVTKIDLKMSASYAISLVCNY